MPQKVRYFWKTYTIQLIKVNLPTNTESTNAYFFVFLGELLIVTQFIDAFRNANDVSAKINYRLAHLPNNGAIIIKKS